MYFYPRFLAPIDPELSDLPAPSLPGTPSPDPPPAPIPAAAVDPPTPVIPSDSILAPPIPFSGEVPGVPSSRAPGAGAALIAEQPEPEPVKDDFQNPFGDFQLFDATGGPSAAEQHYSRARQIDDIAATTLAESQASALAEASAARAERAKDAEQQESRLKEARGRAEEARKRYADLARTDPPMRIGIKAGIIAHALAGMFSKDPSRSLQQIDKLVAMSAREFEGKLSRERDLVEMAGDEVSAAEDEMRAADGATKAIVANIYGELAEEAALLKTQATAARAQAGYQSAEEEFRAREQQAQAEAEAANFERGMKLAEVQRRSDEDAFSRQYKAESLAQRERESRRKSGLDYARLGLDREKLALSRDELEQEREKEAAQASQTGVLVDPGSSSADRAIFQSRFSGDKKQMVKDQDTLNTFVESMRAFREYDAVLRKAAAGGRRYSGPGSSRARSDTLRELDALHGDLLSKTIKALTGATATEAEMERIEATIPSIKKWSDIGSWDPVKFSRQYGDRMADSMDTFLLSRAPVGANAPSREEILKRSPSRRWRGQAPAKESRSDKIDRALLDRSPRDKYFALSSLFGKLKRGELTRAEATEVVDSVVRVTGADVPASEQEAMDKFAEAFVEEFSRARFSPKSRGGVDRVIGLETTETRKRRSRAKKKADLQRAWDRAKGKGE